MKITRERLSEIIQEELQKEGHYYGATPDPTQGEEPDGAAISDAITDLRAAREIVARALPELLEELDYVIEKMKGINNLYPPEAIQPYTVFEKDEK